MKKHTLLFNVLQCVFFLLYFAVLTAERIISLAVALKTPFPEMDSLDAYMTILTLVSLCGGWICLAVFGRGLFSFKEEKAGSEFIKPCVAAGILLLGGMVHTQGTVAPVQFVSYGCLLAAMLLHTIRGVSLGGKGVLRWTSFVYITALSMSIPVVYKTACVRGECALCGAFYPVECIASILLVALFTALLVTFYRREGLLTFCPFGWIAVAVLDAAALALRWHESINMFVLIFAALTVAVGIVGTVIYRLDRRKRQPEKPDRTEDNQ